MVGIAQAFGLFAGIEVVAKILLIGFFIHFIDHVNEISVRL